MIADDAFEELPARAGLGGAGSRHDLPQAITRGWLFAGARQRQAHSAE